MAPASCSNRAERGQAGRYSFVGVGPHRVIRWVAGELKEFRRGDMSGEGAPIATFPAADPCDGVKEYLSRYRVAETPGMPPFAGGAVGLRL